MLEFLDILGWIFPIMLGIIILPLALVFALLILVGYWMHLVIWLREKGWIREKRKTCVSLPVLQECPRCHQLAVRSHSGGLWDGWDNDGNHAAFGVTEQVECGTCGLKLERHSTYVRETGFSDDGTWKEMSSDDPNWVDLERSLRDDQSKPIQVF